MSNEANPDIGTIGNCAISALIDAQARIGWFRVPRFARDPVFHVLLDRDACDRPVAIAEVIRPATRWSAPQVPRT